MSVDRKSRMVGNVVIEIEATEPAVSEVELNFLAQLPFGADAVAVADDEHPDHEFGIDRRSPNLTVKGFQFAAQVSQYPRHRRIDATQEMPHRDTPFEVKQIEQLALIDHLPTHHDPPPPDKRIIGGSESRFADDHEPFFNSIGQKQSCGCVPNSPRLTDCAGQRSSGSGSSVTGGAPI